MNVCRGRWLIGCLIVVIASCDRPSRSPSTQASTAPSTQVTYRPPTTRHAGIEQVLVISVDGLRPDVMLIADAPNLRALMRRGAYSLYARTIADAYTLPAHVSMLTGVTSEKHGVTWNDYTEDAYPQVPTLFEVAKRKNLTTAIAVAKMKFIVFKKPGVLDWCFIADEDKQTDADVTREAIAIVRDHKPNVMFFHLGNVDVVGHAKGWGSSDQLAAVHEADARVGQLLDAVRAAQLEPSTLIFVTSDHGGSGRGHGPDDEPTKFIPWIVAGPGVRKGYDLTLLRGRGVWTGDTFATAAAALGVEIPTTTEGRSVESIYQPGELVHDVMPEW